MARKSRIVGFFIHEVNSGCFEEELPAETRTAIRQVTCPQMTQRIECFIKRLDRKCGCKQTKKPKGKK